MVVAQVGEDPDGQGIGGGQAAVGSQAHGIDAHVGHGGEALGPEGLQAGLEAGLPLGARGFGDVLVHQVHGGVHEDPRGLARGIPQDAAAFRVRRGGADARRRQSRRVHPGGVAIHPLQEGWAGARGGSQVGSTGEASPPAVLVPAPAQHPAFGMVLAPGADAVLGLLEAADTRQVHLPIQGAEALHMGVALHQTRQQGAARQGDAGGAGVGAQQGLGGPHSEDAPLAEGHGLPLDGAGGGPHRGPREDLDQRGGRRGQGHGWLGEGGSV